MSLTLKQFVRLKFDWLEQVAADDGLPPQAARVAIRLALHLNNGTLLARPGYRRIAADLCINHETVILTVRALIDRGHLVVAIAGRPGRGSSNQYRLILKADEKVGCSGPLGHQEKVGCVRPLAETEKVGFEPPKRSDVSDQNPIKEPYPYPCGENPSAEGAPSAEPRAAESDDDRRAQDAAEFLAVMPHRPDHVAKPSKRILAAYAVALAGGATKDEILAGAHRCKTYHATRYGDGVCGYAPSPLAFLRDAKWTATWQLPAPPPAKTRKRSINPNDGDEAREALRREMRGETYEPNVKAAARA